MGAGTGARSSRKCQRATDAKEKQIVGLSWRGICRVLLLNKQQALMKRVSALGPGDSAALDLCVNVSCGTYNVLMLRIYTVISTQSRGEEI